MFSLPSHISFNHYFLIALLQLFSAVSFAFATNCGDWAAYKTEKCFKVFDSSVLHTYDEARAICARHGNAQLPSIGSAEEEAFLIELLYNHHHHHYPQNHDQNYQSYYLHLLNQPQQKSLPLHRSPNSFKARILESPDSKRFYRSYRQNGDSSKFRSNDGKPHNTYDVYKVAYQVENSGGLKRDDHGGGEGSNSGSNSGLEKVRAEGSTDYEFGDSGNNVNDNNANNNNNANINVDTLLENAIFSDLGLPELSAGGNGGGAASNAAGNNFGSGGHRSGGSGSGSGSASHGAAGAGAGGFGGGLGNGGSFGAGGGGDLAGGGGGGLGGGFGGAGHGGFGLGGAGLGVGGLGGAGSAGLEGGAGSYQAAGSSLGASLGSKIGGEGGIGARIGGGLGGGLGAGADAAFGAGSALGAGISSAVGRVGGGGSGFSLGGFGGKKKKRSIVLEAIGGRSGAGDDGIVFEPSIQQPQFSDNIWLGSQFRPLQSTYTWDDYSDWHYSHWAAGFPVNRAGYCVQMDSSPPFAWSDTSCLKRNLVLCQREQLMPGWKLEDLLNDLQKNSEQLQPQFSEPINSYGPLEPYGPPEHQQQEVVIVPAERQIKVELYPKEQLPEIPPEKIILERKEKPVVEEEPQIFQQQQQPIRVIVEHSVRSNQQVVNSQPLAKSADNEVLVVTEDVPQPTPDQPAAQLPNCIIIEHCPETVVVEQPQQETSLWPSLTWPDITTAYDSFRIAYLIKRMKDYLSSYWS